MLRSGTLRSILLILVIVALVHAAIGQLGPLLGDLAKAFPGANLGMTVGIMMLIPAFIATAGGALVKAIGARRVLIAITIAMVPTQLLAFWSPNILVLDIARILAGFGFLFAAIAGPTLIIQSAGKMAGLGMSLYAAVPPVCMTIAMLTASRFAGTPNWRWTFAVHASILLVFCCLLPLLPDAQVSAGSPRVADQRAPAAEAKVPFSSETRVFRAIAAFCFSCILGFGAMVILPTWFARNHHVPVGSITAAIGLISLISIPMSFVIPSIVKRIPAQAVAVTVIVLTAVSGALIYLPSFSLPLAYAGVVLWLASNGATNALIFMLIPLEMKDVAHAPIATGVLMQANAIVCFCVPILYVALSKIGNPNNFLYLVLTCCVIILVLAPIWGSASKVAELRTKRTSVPVHA